LQSRETNGGWSAELQVKNFDKESRHTIILARSIYEEVRRT